MYKVVFYNPKKLGGVSRVVQDLQQGMLRIGIECEEEGSLLKLIWKAVWYRDYIYVTCLHAFLVNFFAKNTIFVLHGWPTTREYRLFKRLVMQLAFKLGSLSSSRTVAVSELTRIVNYVQFGIVTDVVIHNPINLMEISSKLHQEKVILFCGTLIEGKGILEIIKVFEKRLESLGGYQLKIIGDGPLKNKIIEKSKCPNIEYIGPIYNRVDLMHHFMTSEIFISLNEMEPFGVVFLEAMNAELKIICPTHGGQNEFIPPDYPAFRVENSYCESSIHDAILCAINAKDWKFDSRYLKRFSCESVAQKYYNICEEIR